MKKIFIITILMLSILTFPTYATEVNNSSEKDTNIPSMSLEDFAYMMQVRQSKVDIIKKNNVEITDKKVELKNTILQAAEKVSRLSEEVSRNEVEISDETIMELKGLLELLQEAKTTLETDAQKISDEIEKILDLISTKGMELEQYDLLIERQNAVIIKMKEIIANVNKI